MKPLLVLDLDGTLCASPRVPNGDDFAAWERLLLDAPSPVVPGALAGVEELLCVSSRVLILTARSLQPVTAQWLCDAFPSLQGCLMLMRPIDDYRPSALVKWDRFHAWRREHHDGPILLVDDDPAMIVACTNHLDRFLLAPSCWFSEARRVADLLEAAGRGTALDGEG